MSSAASSLASFRSTIESAADSLLVCYGCNISMVAPFLFWNNGHTHTNIYLAAAELYNGLANVIRRIDFGLRETGVQDVEAKRERIFIP